MTEYIKKDDALECCPMLVDRQGYPYDTSVEYDRISELEPENVVPVVRGKWELELDRRMHWHCSECGYVVGLIKMDCNFCPNCGADMRGEEID